MSRPSNAVASASAAFVLFLASCAAKTAGASAPQDAATTITRAVYANDYDATVANFDDATKKTITRADLGELSDRMHALGDFVSLAERSAQPDAGRYLYDASFSGGRMVVELRVDASGKVGAYRVLPATPLSQR